MKIRIGFAPSAVDAAVVDALEQSGLDSLWAPETLTGAAADPIAVLAFAAGRTKRIKLGTQLVLPGRNLYRLAKQTATLDRLSNGRLLVTFVPGLEDGPELQAVGVERKQRSASLVAGLNAVRTLWAGGAVDGIALDITPIQQPLEVWLGGIGPLALRRAGAMSDGWIPGFVTVAEAAAGVVAITAAATEAGRAIDPEHFGANILYSADDRAPSEFLARLTARRPDVDPRTLVAVGWDGIRTRIHEYLAVGISKFVIRPAAPPASWTDEIAAAGRELSDAQT